MSGDKSNYKYFKINSDLINIMKVCKNIYIKN